MKAPCAHCGKVKTRHARGLCGLCYRDHRDEFPKVKFHRPYTTREREIIRRDWGKVPAATVAAALGRDVRDVYAAAVRFGATQTRRTLKTDAALRENLVRLHGTGLSDREIGRVVGFGHATVARWLRRLKLPSNCRTKPTDPFPERTRQKLREVKLRQIRELGPEAAIAFLRKHAEGRAKAARMGWPQAQTLREARILDHLRAGPATADAVAAMLGIRRAWAGAVIRSMRRRGLLTRPGRSGRDMLYALAHGVAPTWSVRDPRMKREAACC